MKKILIVVLLLAATAAEARDPKQVAAFRRVNACPESHKTTGPCYGWVVDHKIALCAGGADKPSNMHWQEYKASLVKDAEERRYCAKLRGMSKRAPVAAGAQ